MSRRRTSVRGGGGAASSRKGRIRVHCHVPLAPRLVVAGTSGAPLLSRSLRLGLSQAPTRFALPRLTPPRAAPPATHTRTHTRLSSSSVSVPSSLAAPSSRAMLPPNASPHPSVSLTPESFSSLSPCLSLSLLVSSAIHHNRTFLPSLPLCLSASHTFASVLASLSRTASVSARPPPSPLPSPP